MPRPNGVLRSNPQILCAGNEEYHCGYFQDIGAKKNQEDEICMVQLTDSELIPKDSTVLLEPEQLAYRLWTCHLQLDDEVKSLEYVAGSTASTTLYNGINHLISANLGDTLAFVVAYDSQGCLRSVKLLNSVIHHPDIEKEAIRIKTGGGYIKNARVNGALALSRVIGDNSYKQENKTPISAESKVDIIDIKHLLDFAQQTQSKVQLIVCSDGFTESLKTNASKKEYQDFLFNKLSALKTPGKLTETDLAEELVGAALAERKHDNITVAVQTITKGMPVMVGVYDGHAGSDVARYVMQYVSVKLIRLCTMSQQNYINEPNSVYKYKYRYDLDHDVECAACTDWEFAVLYPNNVLTKKELLNLRTNFLLKNCLHLLQSLDINIAPEYLFLQQHDYLSELIEIIKFIAKRGLFNYELFGSLKAQNKLEQLNYVIKQVAELHFISIANVKFLVEHKELEFLLQSIMLCVKNDRLDLNCFQLLVANNETESLHTILRHLDQNNLLTIRNLTLIFNLKDIKSALVSIKIDAANQLITWNGPTLHNKLISQIHYQYKVDSSDDGREHLLSIRTIPQNLKLQFRGLEGDFLKTEILKYFKDLLDLTGAVEELENCITEIQAMYEYELLGIRQDLSRFFNPFQSAALKAFGLMVNEKRRIILEIEQIIGGEKTNNNNNHFL